MTTRHEFLTQLHSLIKPERYLETGVQHGHSLNLAHTAKVAIGIDPQPLCQPHGNQIIYTMTSDDYFQYMADGTSIDFAFIDGSHLFEDALRDFINIEMCSDQDAVVVFDDVLPTTQEMTSRMMIPGHWTGDVWKVHQILTKYRPDLYLLLVDTEPTGTMVVYDLDRKNKTLPMVYTQIVDEYLAIEQVPDSVLTRLTAVSTAIAIEIVTKRFSKDNQT